MRVRPVPPAARQRRTLSYAATPVRMGWSGASWTPQPPMSHSVVATMAETKTSTSHPRRRAVYVLAFAALCIGLVVAIGIPSAGAKRANVMGKTKHTPVPSCGNKKDPDACSVVGRVTGYMTVADGNKHPFNVFKNGKIVAWAIDVSRPLQSKKFPQRNYFGTLFGNDKFGKRPTARLAVIKRKEKHKFKLIRQSKTVELGSTLGHKQIFTLDKPLKVRKGQVVALTYPTWASNFAFQGLDTKGNQWRGSRTKDHCEPKHPNKDSSKRRFAKKSRPQEKVGSTRPYECNYTGGRILYWAYFVPSKKK